MTPGAAGDVLIRSGVILTGRALFKGWAITTTLWLVGLYIVLAATSQGFLLDLALMVLMYGYGIALVTGVPLAWILGRLLRPIRNQWIHVAAFFIVPTLGFWALGSVLGFGWSVGALGLWATVGFAAALGRLAVWRDVAVR
ncbi:hypothetical protein DC347_03760 [Pseudarthrobacter sp. AG30]|uniref:hypothetical protein n=1 Tax=Micrococcaceae TaxID=1268 RepID=UPI00036ABE7F|nr:MULTISPECIES: hypothetical protein [Micrococcaceae]RAX17855.1 hypothetical protein DC347_03760 [Pseudarthrobacter sp. AG30]TDT80464.1 hypothetical protein DFO47_104364 [Arthrobacter sp. AG258]